MRASSSSWPLTWRMTSQRSCVSTSSPPSRARREAALPISLGQEQVYWVGCLCFFVVASPNTTDHMIYLYHDFSWNLFLLEQHHNDPMTNHLLKVVGLSVLNTQCQKGLSSGVLPQICFAIQIFYKCFDTDASLQNPETQSGNTVLQILCFPATFLEAFLIITSRLADI